MALNDSLCKICGYEALTLRAHTARCPQCGVLLYYPYPSDEELRRDESPEEIQAEYVAWYERASYRSHENFTTVIDFTISPDRASEALQLLDFGGGGGQFALVARSHLPHADVSIVDVSDAALLEPWKSFNRPIRFEDFDNDGTRFDYIFMNDVFEHLSDPVGVLSRLRGKLAPDGGIFIDTQKLAVSSALTMDADFYLERMGIRGGPLLAMGRLLHAAGRLILRNKIFCVLR